MALLGGHTVQDAEIKFGYAVTGDVTTGRIWSNAGARPGDDLLLTKPLGTGVVATALKFDRAPGDVVDAAIASMTTLNRVAAEALQALPQGAVHALHGCHWLWPDRPCLGDGDRERVHARARGGGDSSAAGRPGTGAGECTGWGANKRAALWHWRKGVG